MNNLDAALASLSLPEPSVESIQASGLRPDAFIYLTVQHQRVVRYQISFIFACWLATITIILYPKRLIRLFQRLLWILNVVFACCTGKRNIKNYRQFINKAEKGEYCEKCDATRHGQGDGRGRRGEALRVGSLWNRYPFLMIRWLPSSSLTLSHRPLDRRRG